IDRRPGAVSQQALGFYVRRPESAESIERILRSLAQRTRQVGSPGAGLRHCVRHRDGRTQGRSGALNAYYLGKNGVGTASMTKLPESLHCNCAKVPPMLQVPMIFPSTNCPLRVMPVGVLGFCVCAVNKKA